MKGRRTFSLPETPTKGRGVNSNPGAVMRGGLDEQEELVEIRIDAAVLISELYYENIDANIMVKAFDSAGAEQWSNHYYFDGPDVNTFEIKNGFHHYSIGMVDKWGINDIHITAKDILDYRAQGIYILLLRSDRYLSQLKLIRN